MYEQLFLNLPVKDLNRSIDFFTKLGFEFDPNLSDDNGACMIINQNTCVMLFIEGFLSMFTTKPVCDTKKCIEMAISLPAQSREKVDEMIVKATEFGALEAVEPKDCDGMYGRSFEDIDGHIWAIFHMG